MSTKLFKGYYPAFEYVLEYSTEGTKKEDWYLGSIDELQEVFNNCLLLNIAKLLNSGEIFNARIWSSTEHSVSSAWILFSGSHYNYGGFKIDSFPVYPLLQIKL